VSAHQSAYLRGREVIISDVCHGTQDGVEGEEARTPLQVEPARAGGQQAQHVGGVVMVQAHTSQQTTHMQTLKYRSSPKHNH